MELIMDTPHYILMYKALDNLTFSAIAVRKDRGVWEAKPVRYLVSVKKFAAWMDYLRIELLMWTPMSDIDEAETLGMPAIAMSENGSLWAAVEGAKWFNQFVNEQYKGVKVYLTNRIPQGD